MTDKEKALFWYKKNRRLQNWFSIETYFQKVYGSYFNSNGKQIKQPI